MAEQPHYVKYTFYKADPLWRRLPHEQKAAGARAFESAVDAWRDSMLVRTYNLQGTRGDADFLLWQVAPELSSIQQSFSDLANTGLGQYLNVAYSYLAMTKHSPYVAGHTHAGQEGTGLVVRPKDATYFFVYPFVKTNEWYQLPMADRQRMMNEHFEIGHKYPGVKITTSYSFGLDDQEFMLGFETEKPEDFVDLIQALRSSQARPYTLRDTPIFTCVNTELKDILATLVG